MKTLTCPACGGEMVKKRDPDIIVDECLACTGVFLDRGELEVVATGSAGEVEYAPVDIPFYADRFPVRDCPKCSGRRMKKVNLLRLPDLIFDRCPGCKGFYLDGSECGAMNESLRKQAPNDTAEEFRGQVGGRLVRIDRVDHTQAEPVAAESGRALISCHLRVNVYFHHPLDVDIRILQNKWTTLLARLFGVATGQRIKTGHDAFDEVFSVHSPDRRRVLDLIPQPFAESMLTLVRDEPSVFGSPGETSVCRTCISYVEGPYAPEVMGGLSEKCRPLVEKLLRLAELIDTDGE